MNYFTATAQALDEVQYCIAGFLENKIYIYIRTESKPAIKQGLPEV
jgi:hypothetical protein